MFTTVTAWIFPTMAAVVHPGLPYGHIQDGAEEAN